MSTPTASHFHANRLSTVFEQVVYHSPEMVVLTDAQHTVIWVNAAFVHNTGWAASDCEEKPLRDLFSGEVDQQHGAEVLMSRLIQEGCLHNVEIQVGPVPGETQSLRVDVDAFRNGAGEVVAHVCRFGPGTLSLGPRPGQQIDGAPVVDSEDSGPGAQAVLSLSSERLVGPGTPTRLHAFTRPLKALSEATQKMNECLVAGSLSAFGAELDRAFGSVATLKGKVDALLGGSQAVIGELPQRRIDTGELVHELVDLLMSKTGERTIAWTIDPELPQIEADPALVREVWNKLLANALTRSAYQDVSLIEVGWKPQARGWEFFVHDNGCSFDAEQAGQLFEVLAKPAGRERSASAGAGRSLALVRRIVEIHGGRVWSHSELGQGASFHFFLPSRMAPVPPARADTAPLPMHST